ncbi:MAG TPA: glycoside hydrolase family 43 protein [Polyangiaceae bacterium]
MKTKSMPEQRPFRTRSNVSAHRGLRAGVRTAIAASSLGLVTSVPSPCWADNPIVQTNYTADPAPVVYGDRLYVYTSHDEDVTVNDFYTMNDWRLYSTVDMVNWTDHGSPGGLDSFSWSTDNAWAPQGIARNGQYYLFVPLNNNTGAKIGVGVADNPAGPIMDPLGRALAASGSGNIDPTVFIDDDDQAYMYWGNGTLRYVKLNSDMISYTGSVTNVTLSGFVEGPWFYKRESLYYMVYAASGTGTEKLSYATSNGPTGPWTTRGDIMPSGSTYTNHPGVVDYKGRSYFFYHNSALPGGNDYKRSVCVEEFTYGSDGSIPRISMSSEGPDGIASLNPFQQVEAETIAFSAGLKTEACTDAGGGINVSSISNGDYIKVKDVDFLDGVTSFDARVSSSGSNAKIELRLDSQTGTLLGTCDVSGVSSWTTKTCEVSGGSGRHDLFLKFTGGSGDLFKFNWWKFDGPNTGGTGGAGGMGGAAGAGAAGGSGAGTGGAAGGDSGMGGAAGSAGGAVAGNGGRGGGGGEPASGGSMGVSGGGGQASGGSAGANGGNATGGSGGVPTSGSAGTAGRGNAGAGGTLTNGGSASGGDAGVTNPDDDSGSCGCRQVGKSGNQGVAQSAWLVAACALLVRRRRAR